ncbi:hypothetical protein [Duganella dendranthematis]|uniref:hypothetical protein n=1 Tax=Duganella dendranthematis TaxID=2728021 RepID=UPI001E5F3437|nr:hypothetical protein [Duganella dendranthematis]
MRGQTPPGGAGLVSFAQNAMDAGHEAHIAQRLEYGMQLLIADGRFDQLFHQFYDALIDKVGMRKRRIFRLENPLLSPQTPLSNRAYWFDPFDLPR